MSEEPPDILDMAFDGNGASGMVRARSRHQRHLATTARLHALRSGTGDEAMTFARIGEIMCESFAARSAIIRHFLAPELPLGEARFERDEDGEDTQLRMQVRLSDGDHLLIVVERPYHELGREPAHDDQRDALAHFEELGRVLVDVLDAERTLSRLRLREAELSSMLGAMPDILTIVDGDGRIVHFHDGDERHRFADSEFVGKHLSDLMPPAVWHDALPVLERAIVTRRMQEHRYVIERDGRALHFVSRGQAYGDPVRVLWHTRDVSEERQLQEKLFSIQRFEGIALLASALGHDFSNLLTGILGNAEFARSEIARTGAASDALSDVISAARRASELCQQLLGMSGKHRLSLGFVNLSALCAEMLVILRTSIGRRVTVVRELTSPEHMPMLIGDAIQLRQIVLNLLSNAADAIGDDGGAIIVRTGVVGPTQGGDDGPSAYLEVEDSGRGMDEIARRRLLQPFSSVPLEARELGLAATFGIVRGHGGTVEVGAAEGGGTRVRVLLPLDREMVADANDDGGLTQEVLTAPLLRGGLVLVVTADQALAATCRRLLEQAGHRVQHIGSGDEAIIALRTIAPLLRGIILDGKTLGPNTSSLVLQVEALAPKIPSLVLDVEGALDGTPNGERQLSSDNLARALSRLLTQL